MNVTYSLMLIGGLAITCSSCNAIRSCFGAKDSTIEAHASNCAKCGGTSCSIECGGDQGHGPGPLISSCSLSATAQADRAEALKRSIFSKAIGTRELEDGYAIQFNEPDEFIRDLEEVVRFEQQCCANFTWAAVANVTGQELHVTAAGRRTEVNEALKALGWME